MSAPLPDGGAVAPAKAVSVVKLGGSLAESGALRPWLQELSSLRGAGLVVVPGGGPFADAVRQAQRRHGFSDQAAHCMALAAMEQFGLMLCDLAAALVPAATAQTIALAVARGDIPVWMPTRMLAGHAEVRASWDVTSDSLAAWLASALEARSLTLVKSAAPPRAAGGALGPERLAAAGYVDAAFAAAIRDRPFRVGICGPGEHENFRRAILAGLPTGSAVGQAA